MHRYSILLIISLASAMACSDPGVYNPGDPATQEFTLTQVLRCLNGQGDCSGAGVPTIPLPIPGTATPAYIDVSAGQGADSGKSPSALIDFAAAKLLVATRNIFAGDVLSLFRCDPDGSNCAHHDISAGAPPDSARAPSAAIDTINNKLLVVTRDNNNGLRPLLYRCDTDGTGCTRTDISGGAGANSAISPTALVDIAGGKLLVVTDDGSNAGRPGLFRCNLDGTSCAKIDISAGQGGNSCETPSAVLDTINNKLLAVCRNTALSDIPALFRCNPDGTGCTHTDLSTALPGITGHLSTVAVDTVHEKLMVAVRNQSDNNLLYLIRCDLDGTNCAAANISAGQPANSANNPSMVLDLVNGKVLVSTSNNANGSRPSLYRCDLDGSNCAHTDLSAGRGTDSGKTPSAVNDTLNGKLLVVTHDDSVAGGGGLGLFRN